MGGGSYSYKDWDTFSTKRKYHSKSTKTEDIFSSRTIDPILDPKNFKIRESVDGPDNPESTPVIIGLDVTGSMNPVIDSLARKGMKTICEGIYNRKPIPNPHICALGIGDVECDAFPFQATQFEADVRIFEQLEKLYLEGGGGGNNYESYILAWWFAKYRTKTDSFTKRGRKGFIFTIGDEEITRKIQGKEICDYMGEHQSGDFTPQYLIEQVLPEWEVFHVIIKQGTYARSHFDKVRKSWSDIIGPQRVIPLDDYTKAGEVIVSAIEVCVGKSVETVSKSWDGTTSVVVENAVKGLRSSLVKKAKSIDSYL